MNKKPKFRRSNNSWDEFASAAIIGYMSSCSLHDEPMVWAPKIAEMAAEMADKMMEEKFKDFPE